MRPGLRFQILLILLGTLGLAFGMVASVGLVTLDRLEAEVRGGRAEAEARALASAAAVACPGKDRACLASWVAKVGDGRLVPRGTPRAADVAGTRLAIAVPAASPGRALGPARRFLLGFLALDLVITLLISVLALFRGVVRPIEDLAAQADQVARLEFGGLGEGHQFGRLGTSFRRMVGALSDERARVQRQIEELEAANRSLREAQEGLVRSEKLATVGRLAAGVAHEIGNPLGGLIGYLEILKPRLEGDAAAAPLVEGGLSAARRIDQTIRDLLDFSRPGESAKVPFPVAEVVDEALRLCRPQARFAEVEVHLDLPEGLPVVEGDRRRFTQVLVNLFLNAADAMEGTGVLEIGAAAEGARLRLEVADSGPGLPEGVGDEIFEPFFTTKEPGQGTGLGLAISRRLVEGWGGRLEATGRPGGGAAFVVTLPVSASN